MLNSEFNTLVKFFSDPFLARWCLLLLNWPCKCLPTMSLWRDLPPVPWSRTSSGRWRRQRGCLTNHAVSSFAVLFLLTLSVYPMHPAGSAKAAMGWKNSQMWLVSTPVTSVKPGEKALTAMCCRVSFLFPCIFNVFEHTAYNLVMRRWEVRCIKCKSCSQTSVQVLIW